MSRRVVRRLDEETECEWCGYPMYVGDWLLDTPEGPVYCSGRCRALGDAQIRTMAGEREERA